MQVMLKYEKKFTPGKSDNLKQKKKLSAWSLFMNKNCFVTYYSLIKILCHIFSKEMQSSQYDSTNYNQC